MTIEKKSIVDQIEITRSGIIQIRIALELVEDGKVLNYKWHRTSIEQDGDVDAQMLAVNNHLESMNEALISQEDIAKIKAYHEVII